MCCGSARGGEGARGPAMSRGHMKPAAVWASRFLVARQGHRAIMSLQQTGCGVTNDH